MKQVPLPDHDPERDGNIFQWIIATAPKVRAERAYRHLERRLEIRTKDRIANRPIPGAKP